MDKNSDGDYLISARYTNTIYKVSGRDGSIIWRLGGVNSSFVLDGFNFSSQHDARFREENSTTTVISFLNNASDGDNSTSSYSSGLLVALQTSTTPMTAHVIKRWDRPDRQLSPLRGNVQILPNDNVFIGWSVQGYLSEFSSDGRCVLEAKFSSIKFIPSTYRAYKYNFTGIPSELPVSKAFVYGTTADTVTSVFYVSWNGATEVAHWNFYGNNTSSSEFSLVGTAKKSGFETSHMVSGFSQFIYAEAVSSTGHVLGKSLVVPTIVPPSWRSPTCRDGDCHIDTVFSSQVDQIDEIEGNSPLGRKGELFAKCPNVIQKTDLVRWLSYTCIFCSKSRGMDARFISH